MVDPISQIWWLQSLWILLVSVCFTLTVGCLFTVISVSNGLFNETFLKWIFQYQIKIIIENIQLISINSRAQKLDPYHLSVLSFAEYFWNNSFLSLWLYKVLSKLLWFIAASRPRCLIYGVFNLKYPDKIIITIIIIETWQPDMFMFKYHMQKTILLNLVINRD